MPVLVYVLGQPVKDATTMSLLVVAAAAAVGSLDHARHGRIDTRSGLAFGAAGAVGALPGTLLNRVLPEQLLLAAFAIVLLAAAAMMLRRHADLLAPSRKVSWTYGLPPESPPAYSRA